MFLDIAEVGIIGIAWNTLLTILVLLVPIGATWGMVVLALLVFGWLKKVISQRWLSVALGSLIALLLATIASGVIFSATTFLLIETGVWPTPPQAVAGNFDNEAKAAEAVAEKRSHVFEEIRNYIWYGIGGPVTALLGCLFIGTSDRTSSSMNAGWILGGFLVFVGVVATIAGPIISISLMVEYWSLY